MASAGVCAWCRKRPPHPDWRPFCSERCRLLDLGHWLDGGYQIPGEPVDPAADADDTDTDRSDHSPRRRT